MIERKREELLDDLDNKYKKLLEFVKDSSITNTTYSRYMEAKTDLLKAADKIIEFNSVVEEFFGDYTKNEEVSFK